MELLTILLFWFLGYVMGWLNHSTHVAKRILKDPDYMINILEKYKTALKKENAGLSDARELIAEKQKDMFYLFAKDNNEFIGQGKTVEEALEAAKKRFPNQSFKGIIPADQAREWGLSKQQ